MVELPFFPHRWKDEGPENDVLTTGSGSSSPKPSVNNFKQTSFKMCFCEFNLLPSFHESTKYTFFFLMVALYTHWSCKGTRSWLYFRDQKRESFPLEGRDIVTHESRQTSREGNNVDPKRPTEGLVIFSRRTFVYRISVSVNCFWIRTKVCSCPPYVIKQLQKCKKWFCYHLFQNYYKMKHGILGEG